MWIAGRVQVLLSHYFQPDQPIEVQAAALRDWVSVLEPFPQHVINRACERYIRNQPRRRPTPGDIRAMCEATPGDRKTTKGEGDRSTLAYDELEQLETKLIPTARKWLEVPGLHEHGKAFLAYWGETV